MIKFDSKGNLTPYSKIEITFEQFEQFFVADFDKNSIRYHIFAIYEKFLSEFQKEVTSTFTLWINGSFTTEKMNPKDGAQ